MKALEFRPDDEGEFDELVARFADGGVFVETMNDQGVYIDFSWNDGRHCQFWITVKGRSKLRYYHEDSAGNPPKFDAWGNLNAQRIAAGTDETRNAAQPEGQEPDGEADAPTPYTLNQGPTHER